MSKRRTLTLVATAALAVLVASCDEAEQDRILLYKKGTYLGNPDTPLSEQKVDELRQRAMQQTGA